MSFSVENDQEENLLNGKKKQELKKENVYNCCICRVTASCLLQICCLVLFQILITFACMAYFMFVWPLKVQYLFECPLYTSCLMEARL
jgi:hypothetical protein